MSAAPTIQLYAFTFSGHSHRAELFLNLLQLPYERIEVDLRAGAQKQPDFLQLNPFGQIPVLRDGDTVLPDSNAILVYLAKRYGDSHWLPEEPVAAARVQRWLSVASGELVQGPALARVFSTFYKGDPAPHRERATVLLGRLEAQLSGSAYLTGDQPTIADVALYTYIAIAPEGGIALEAYPTVRAWLQRIEALPGFLPMPRLPQTIAS